MRPLLTLLFLAALTLGIYNNLPPREHALATQWWEETALPFRVSRLIAQPPDTTLLMPVQGVSVRRIANTWQAPRSGRRQHEGQDIFAPKGTPVYSATNGIVTAITDHTLGGNSVFVTGAGSRTYFYTHLDRYAAELSVGDIVTPDTVLGYVGNSGNARTTPAHLHFGVYTAQGALNPLPLLQDRPAAQNAPRIGKLS